jgi:hypothetical protein
MLGCATCRTRPAASRRSSPGATSRAHRAGRREATGVEYLRTLALARIVLDNFDNLQASWVTQGGKVGQLSLAFGANDMGSVMIEENVVRAAGAEPTAWTSRDRAQHRERRVRRQAPQHALRGASATRSSASATCRGCWSWRHVARPTATPSVGGWPFQGHQRGAGGPHAGGANGRRPRRPARACERGASRPVLGVAGVVPGDPRGGEPERGAVHQRARG